MKGISDTSNAGKVTMIISLGANLTILLGTDTFVKLKAMPDQRMLLWKYEIGTLGTSVQYQSWCEKL